MIDIEKEMKNALNVSEDEFCKYIEPGSTKSLAWWNDIFNIYSLNKQSFPNETAPGNGPKQKGDV